MTIKDLINKIEDAALSITSMNFRCCFLYELTENETYPLTVLIPPAGEVPDWKNPADDYNIELWILQRLPQSSTDDKDDIWEDLQEWGWDIVNYLADEANRGTGELYYLKRPVRVEFEPVNAYGKDNTPAMVVKFKMEVKNCK